MQGWLDKVLAGERQIVFVTGEAGIGKTALVDAIRAAYTVGLEHPDKPRANAWNNTGRVKHICRFWKLSGGWRGSTKRLSNVLRSHAPMWLLQMPSLVSASDRELLSQEVFGATRERMLREMGEALEALAEDLPLVLILEDLHWSDYSTLDLISYLARQRQAARLMLIGTYRTSELIVSGHPLKAVKRELLAKQQCEELPLEYLSEEAVAKYLSVRFSRQSIPGRAGRTDPRDEQRETRCLWLTRWITS